ncbi:hypothetical protein JW964_01170 [candidate division KSB1 bacterium]|nr:hypothetical protein [candidate division KSB1 bacterium]
MEIYNLDLTKKELCSDLKKRLLVDQEQLIFAKAIQLDLPKFFKYYLKIQVKKIYLSENPISIANNERYNLNTREIKEALAHLESAFQNAVILSEKELAELIEKTISLEFDFLVKPRQTLQQIIFKNKASCSLDQFLQVILSFDDNRPYIRYMMKMAKDMDIKVLTPDTFARIAFKAEEGVYGKNAATTFLDDLAALAEFFKLIRGPQATKIAIKLIVLMLQERNLNSFIKKFKVAYKNNHKSELEFSEIQAILEKRPTTRSPKPDNNVGIENSRNETPVPSGKSVARPEAPKPAPTKTYEAPAFHLNNLKSEFEIAFGSDDLEEKIFSKAARLTNTKDERKENWVIYGTQKSNVIGRENIGKIEKKEPEATQFSKPSVNYRKAESSHRVQNLKSDERWDGIEDLGIRFDAADNNHNDVLPDLVNLIDIKSKKLFVRNIFHKDENAYDKFIIELQALKNWREAKLRIDQELSKRKIDVFSKEAIRLGDIVFGRYFPKKE